MGRVTAEAPASPVPLAEAKAFLRIGTSEEDALLAGILRGAADTCEAFTGRMLLGRRVRETIAGDGKWVRLAAAPVSSITSVAEVNADGAETLLSAAEYAVDIDAAGEGWVRSGRSGRRLRVEYRAGIAEDWNGIPEPLRHGVLRLAAHLYAERDKRGDPPTAVTALWRPWRRMRLR